MKCAGGGKAQPCMQMEWGKLLDEAAGGPEQEKSKSIQPLAEMSLDRGLEGTSAPERNTEKGDTEGAKTPTQGESGDAPESTIGYQGTGAGRR